MLFCCFEEFWGRLTENFFFSQKMTISEFVFLNEFEKGQILRKICICLKIFFHQTSKRGQILTKTVFHLKVSHIQLNYSFMLFWSILGEIHWKSLFLVKKVTSQKEAQIYLESLFFSTSLQRGKSEENLDFYKEIQIFLSICPFSNLSRKKNFLSISVNLSEVTFLTKIEVFIELARKCFKTTGKHNLAECGSFFWRKTVFVNNCAILLLWTKTVVYTKSKFSSGFSPFQTCWEK